MVSMLLAAVLVSQQVVWQTVKSRKGCCGKEVVADKRQLGKKEQEQHSGTLL